jgi:hypothetical protein
LEFEDNVFEFDAQPEEIEFHLNGKVKKHQPSFFVRPTNEYSFIVDAVRSTTLQDEHRTERFAMIRRIYRLRGLRYRILTEKTIRQEPALGNAKALFPFVTSAVDQALLLQASELISRAGPLPLSSLEERLRLTPEGRSRIFALIANRLLAFDRSVPLGSSTQIFLPASQPGRSLMALLIGKGQIITFEKNNLVFVEQLRDEFQTLHFREADTQAPFTFTEDDFVRDLADERIKLIGFGPRRNKEPGRSTPSDPDFQSEKTRMHHKNKVPRAGGVPGLCGVGNGTDTATGRRGGRRGQPAGRQCKRRCRSLQA